jgi:spermidine synthase
LVAVGAVTLLGQVVLLRELLVAFDGSELMLLLGLGAWLLGGGLGAALGRRRAQPSPLTVRLALLAYAALLPLSAASTRALPSLLGAPPGGALPWPLQLTTLAIGVLPCALLAGAMFRVAARAWLAPGRSLAQAYGLESLGAVVGGALATGLAALGQANLVAALLAALLALVATAWPGPGQRSWLRLLTLPGSLVVVLLLATSGPIDRALTGLEHPSLTSSRDTPYGRVTVEQHGAQVVVFHNGALSSETQGVDADAFVHPAALQVEHPRRVLLLGGAGQGLLPPLLRHAPERVDLVEPDTVLLAQLREHLPERERWALDDEVVTVHSQDPRAFLTRPDRYDLILLAQPEPSTVAASRTWTREFFALCAAHLAPGGVLAFSLPGGENLWTPALVWRNAGIHRALQASFDDVLVLPGTANTWLASRAPLERNAAPLGRRLTARVLRSELVSEAYLDYLLDNDRTVEIAALLEASQAPADRDDRPSAATTTLLLWLGRMSPRLALLDPGPTIATLQRVALPVTAGLGLVMLGLAALARRGDRSRSLALALVAGLLGMLLESILLLSFQVQHGVLWGQLGFLLGAFMAGLAVGALALDPLLVRVAHHDALARWLQPGLGLAAVAVCLAAGLLPAEALDLPNSTALLLAAGASTAALFGVAARLAGPEPERHAGKLYAADLVGGCAGVVLATLAIPLLGLTLTAGLALLVALAGLLLLLR